MIGRLAIEFDTLILSDEVCAVSEHCFPGPERRSFPSFVPNSPSIRQWQVYEKITYDGVELVHTAALPGLWDRTIALGSAGKAFNTTGWKLGDHSRDSQP